MRTIAIGLSTCLSLLWIACGSAQGGAGGEGKEDPCKSFELDSQRASEGSGKLPPELASLQDAALADWVRAREQACRETYGSGEPTPEATYRYLHQTSCLDGHLTEITFLLGQAAEGGAETQAAFAAAKEKVDAELADCLAQAEERAKAAAQQ